MFLSRKKIIYLIITSLFIFSSFTGCKNTSENTAGEETASDSVSLQDLIESTDPKLSIELDEEDKITSWDDASSTKISLNSTSASVKGYGASVNDSTITITQAGTYVISGTMTDGSVIVKTEDKDTVRIVLNNASITNTSTAPLIVEDAKKVIITLADNTINSLTDSLRKTVESEDYSSALYSKSDLVFNGTGTLNISASYRNGIKSTDDLIIVSGTFNINSVEDGIIGKDFVGIKNGTITVNSGCDGIKSTYDTDTSKGNIVIEDGDMDITSSNDGIQSENILVINGGTINIKTGNGADNSSKTHSDSMIGNKGNLRIPSTTTSASDSSTEESMKGIKASEIIYIYNGNIVIYADDDAIHTNGAVFIKNGTINIKSGDDAVHADSEITIDNGNITASKCYEGLEAEKITINGGEINITASDDGMNAAGGSVSTPTSFGGGKANASNASNASTVNLTINGGNIYVNASGDGLDSNGTMTINGGNITVCGSVSNDNTALDFDSSCTINGGTLMAFGSIGMLETPTSVSNGCCIVSTFSTTSSGSEYTLKDSSGNVILSYTPDKNYSAAIVYSDKIVSGNTYTVTAGSNSLSVTASSGVTGNNGGMGQMPNGGMQNGGMQGGAGSIPKDDFGGNKSGSGRNAYN
ncbi:MAG: carbohydrate-binding domain-containing protein [Eubacteriales bacterium]|nr:carbohydrate-binding domain-containing protein [Eubacteriales bacterium]